jgi:hypothetical protein
MDSIIWPLIIAKGVWIALLPLAAAWGLVRSAGFCWRWLK